MTPASSDVDLATGLTAAQVAQRVADGQVNAVKDRNARSLSSIVRANTFTYFNALIGGLWVLMLVSAPLIDSLFGLVIVVNTAIGIVQEYRAARTLSKLSLVHQQQATVLRDGEERSVPPNEVGEKIGHIGDFSSVLGYLTNSQHSPARVLGLAPARLGQFPAL